MHHPQPKIPMFILLLLGSLLSACSPAQASPSPSTQPPVAAVTHSPAPSQTTAPTVTEPPTAIPPTPTATATPAPSETPTAAASPTPEAVTALTLRWVDVYAGPGEAYPVLASFAENIRFIVSGRTEAGDWLQIELSPQVPGWIASGNIELAGESEAVRVVDISTLPKLTATPAAIQTGRITAIYHQVNGILAVTASGLQPKTFYRIQVISDQGKMVLNMGLNSNDSGGVVGPGIYRIGDVRVGVYTVQLLLGETVAAKTTFKVEKQN